MRRYWHTAVPAAALLLCTVATTVHAHETVDKAGEMIFGWSAPDLEKTLNQWHLHKAAAEGSVEKIDALLLGGHMVDERISSTQEINRLRAMLDKKSSSSDGKKGSIMAQAQHMVHTAIEIFKSDEYRGLIALEFVEKATALHIAATGHYAAAKRLIEKGADVNAQTQLGMHPVDFSAMSNSVQLLELMLDHGADPERPSSRVRLQPLYWAVQGNAVHTARELLRRGVDVNAKTINGETPMDLAMFRVRRDNSYLLRVLLAEHGGRCAKKICECESGRDREPGCEPPRPRH
ncbi:MAG: hypothetical protein GKR94_20090 [Gammaproteobacteria bacterium]|nr:hypothetical protein [Gammaproteobacteria bacterium]